MTNPGTCVFTSVLADQGTARVLNSPNVIVPYSVADYIAQAYHSARCGRKPTGNQNKFGCASNGVLGLNDIDGTRPTAGSGVHTTINLNFTPTFLHLVYDVVRYATNAPDHIPAVQERFFASTRARVKGYFCSAAAQRALQDYGFLPTVLCGVGS